MDTIRGSSLTHEHTISTRRRRSHTGWVLTLLRRRRMLPLLRQAAMAFRVLVVMALVMNYRCKAATVFRPGDGTLGLLSTSNDIVLGWQFSVLDRTEATGLGWLDVDGDGLVNPHSVGLWTIAGELLAEAIVPDAKSASLENGVRTAPINTVVLLPGIEYVVAGVQPRHACLPLQQGCYETPPNVLPGTQIQFDQVLFHDFVSVVEENIVVTASRIGSLSEPILRYPENVGSTEGFYVGPTLKFSVVPEPSISVLSILAGLFLCTLRGTGFVRPGSHRKQRVARKGIRYDIMCPPLRV